MNTILWIVILVLLLDIAVLYEIAYSKCTQGYKLFCAVIVLLLPIIGVSMYQFIRKIDNMKASLVS